MTLRKRNAITRVFTIFTALISISSIILFLILWFNQSPVFKHINFFTSKNIKELIFETQSGVSFLSILFLMLYAPITGLFIFFNFEKTHSSEILYFTGFLFGCFLECSRLLIPLFALWNSHSSLLIYSTRITFFGEMLAILSLLVTGLSTTVSDVQDSERTLLFIFIVSLFFTMLIPINTTMISKTMRVETGFPITIQIIRLLFILLGTVSFLITFINKQAKEFRNITIDFLCISIGYSIEIFANTLFKFILGILLMSIFTRHFIKNLHNYYMWK